MCLREKENEGTNYLAKPFATISTDESGERERESGDVMIVAVTHR